MQSFPLGVLVLLSFGKCIYIFVDQHNKYRCGYHSKQRINQVHFAKFEKAGIVTSSIGLLTKSTPLGSGCSYRINSTSVFVPGKTLPSIKQIVEQ